MITACNFEHRLEIHTRTDLRKRRHEGTFNQYNIHTAAMNYAIASLLVNAVQYVTARMHSSIQVAQHISSASLYYQNPED